MTIKYYMKIKSPMHYQDLGMVLCSCTSPHLCTSFTVHNVMYTMYMYVTAAVVTHFFMYHIANLCTKNEVILLTSIKQSVTVCLSVY